MAASTDLLPRLVTGPDSLQISAPIQLGIDAICDLGRPHAPDIGGEPCPEILDRYGLSFPARREFRAVLRARPVSVNSEPGRIPAGYFAVIFDRADAQIRDPPGHKEAAVLVILHGHVPPRVIVQPHQLAVSVGEDGETVLIVDGYVNWKAQIVNSDLQTVAKGFKLIQYASGYIHIEGDWAGTIHARWSELTLGQVKKTAYGSFVAKKVYLGNGLVIYRVHFDPIPLTNLV